MPEILIGTSIVRTDLMRLTVTNALEKTDMGSPRGHIQNETKTAFLADTDTQTSPSAQLGQ